MRILKTDYIINQTAALISQSLLRVEDEACRLLSLAYERESSPLCRWAIGEIIENNIIAQNSKSYPCQDCGQAILFVRIGQDLHIGGGYIEDALNNAVALGYKNARKSVADPLTRINTKTNTPAIIHYEITEGESLEILFMAKGAGSENMSKTYMLTPSKGEQGIISSVVDCVNQAGANPCPPIILGVGVGGTMDKAALLAKYALFRPSGEKNGDAQIAELENKILSAVNNLRIGAQGFKGDTTALAVCVETAPTHIGMLPVAVCIQCHSVRKGKIVL